MKKERRSKMKLKTKEITICGMFAALIAIGAFIKIDIPLPLYTMHFTLQWFFVIMAGLLLGAKLGALSVAVYLCMGLVGFPIFAAGGGPAYVLRPGFGFLLGFVGAAYLIGTLLSKMKKRTFVSMLIAAATGMVIYYSVGAVYFYMIKNLYVGESVPFGLIVVQYCLITVIPDFILCALAGGLCSRIHPVFEKIYQAGGQ